MWVDLEGLEKKVVDMVTSLEKVVEAHSEDSDHQFGSLKFSVKELVHHIAQLKTYYEHGDGIEGLVEVLVTHGVLARMSVVEGLVEKHLDEWNTVVRGLRVRVLDHGKEVCTEHRSFATKAKYCVRKDALGLSLKEQYEVIQSDMLKIIEAPFGEDENVFAQGDKVKFLHLKDNGDISVVEGTVSFVRDSVTVEGEVPHKEVCLFANSEKVAYCVDNKVVDLSSDKDLNMMMGERHTVRLDYLALGLEGQLIRLAGSIKKLTPRKEEIDIWKNENE